MSDHTEKSVCFRVLKGLMDFSSKVNIYDALDVNGQLN